MAQPAQSPASSPPHLANFAYSSEELQALLSNSSLDIVGIVTDVPEHPRLVEIELTGQKKWLTTVPFDFLIGAPGCDEDGRVSLLLWLYFTFEMQCLNLDLPCSQVEVAIFDSTGAAKVPPTPPLAARYFGGVLPSPESPMAIWVTKAKFKAGSIQANPGNLVVSDTPLWTQPMRNEAERR